MAPETMVHETRVEVRANERIAPGIFLLTVAGPEVAAAAEPGQFVMIETGPGPVPLLRRPMSFCTAGPAGHPRTAEGEFGILYRVVGTGTRLMSHLAPGDTVACLGPLGHGFRIPAGGEKPVLLVAGGIGVAPFPFLAARLGAANIPWRLLYGARSADLLAGVDWFRSLGADPLLVTEDGSVGCRGLVTGPLADIFGNEGTGFIVCACGPDPMLRAVARLCAARGVDCQLSLESVMPCGFGVCLGCGVPGANREDGYLRVCTDGPVFAREEIAL